MESRRDTVRRRLRTSRHLFPSNSTIQTVLVVLRDPVWDETRLYSTLLRDSPVRRALPRRGPSSFTRPRSRIPRNPGDVKDAARKLFSQLIVRPPARSLTHAVTQPVYDCSLSPRLDESSHFPPVSLSRLQGPHLTISRRRIG